MARPYFIARASQHRGHVGPCGLCSALCALLWSGAAAAQSEPPAADPEPPPRESPRDPSPSPNPQSHRETPSPHIDAEEVAEEVEQLEAELLQELPRQASDQRSVREPAPSRRTPERRTAPEATPDPGAIDEVSVTADRVRRAPGSLHVVGPEVLERFRYDDPHATLQLVPGVYVRQEDGFGLRPNIGIRGAISDRSKKVALMQDGVLFGPAPYSAPAAYYFPIIGRMTEMRVTKGPAAIKYGPQSVGGAIDLRTRAVPSASGGAIDLAGGQYGFGKMHAHYGASGARSGFVIEGVHLRSSGFKELPDDGNTGFHRNEWMFKGHHDFASRPGMQHGLSVQLTYSDEVSNETYLGLTDDDFLANPNRRYAASQLDRMSWHRTSAVVEHHLELGPSLHLTTTAYRHDLSRQWNKVNQFAAASLFDVLSDPNTPRNQLFYQVLSGQADGTSEQERLFIGPNERAYVSEGLQSRLELAAETGPVQHQIELGARLHYDRIRRLHSEDAFELLGGDPSLAGAPTTITTSNEAHTLALALHATDELAFSGLTLTPGVRFELIASHFRDQLVAAAGETEPEAERTVAVLLPGLGAHYALTPDLGLLAGLHRGMSPPAPGANSDVDAEISLNYEAGARYSSGFRRLELLGYFNDYRNLTDVCTLSGGCNEQNLDAQFDAGRARIYGLEAYADDTWLFSQGAVLPSFRVPLSFSYTLTLTEFLETFDSLDPIFGNVEAGDELPYVPRHQGRASVGLELDAAGGYVAANYVGRMREQSGSGAIDAALATDALVTLDVGLHYLPWPALRLYAQARNLLGEQVISSRRPYGARPNAPRWIQLGATLDLD